MPHLPSLDDPVSTNHYSGDVIAATYHIAGSASEAEACAADICIEQTVEFPADLIIRRDIREQIFGKVASQREIAPDRHEVEIHFAVETAGAELTQLLNLLYGNISLKPGIHLAKVDLPESLLAQFRGPRFGIAGLRAETGVRDRPLLCTALKPMGLEPAALADLAYQMALGGIDLIKDDHGLADQAFCPFRERVPRCAEAVQRANRETGHRCLYVANVTAPFDELGERAHRARDAGAGGLLVAPGLTGFDSMRFLAEEDAIALPILCHPALLGAYSAHATEGIAHGVLYGLLPRLAGADGSIFPSYGGRFSFTRDQCTELGSSSTRGLGSLATMFPVPAGGMTVDRVPELIAFYGADIILLIGGDLHRHPDGLTEACRAFVERAAQAR